MDLFRKEAVGNISAHAEKLTAARAVGIRYVLFGAALLICAAMFSVWLIFGEVYETVSVSGIIWPTESGGAVYAEYDGVLSKITVSRGSKVNLGDILAVIPREDILRQIEAQTSGDSAALRAEYAKTSIIRSAVDGIVTYIADENTYVRKGEMIAQITPYDENGNNMTLTAFIPSDKGELVSPGMDVQVMPDFAPREKYGYINAYVSEISRYPVKGNYIKENMSEMYLPSIEEENNYFQLEITLLANADSASRLKWSTDAGSDIAAPMGTVCTADIITAKHRPFRWPF